MREVATAVVGTSSTEKGNKSTVVVLWCAKKAIYIQLWPLGTIKVEKYILASTSKVGG